MREWRNKDYKKENTSPDDDYWRICLFEQTLACLKGDYLCGNVNNGNGVETPWYTGFQIRIKPNRKSALKTLKCFTFTELKNS